MTGENTQANTEDEVIVRRIRGVYNRLAVVQPQDTGCQSSEVVSDRFMLSLDRRLITSQSKR